MFDIVTSIVTHIFIISRLFVNYKNRLCREHPLYVVQQTFVRRTWKDAHLWRCEPQSINAETLFGADTPKG